MQKAWIAALVCAVMSVGAARGQEPVAQTTVPVSTTNTKKELRGPQPDKWWFEVAPYLWGSALKTEVDIGDVSAESDMNFGDVLDKLDMALMLHAEAHRNQWGIFTDVMYSSLSEDEDIGPGGNGELEVKIKQTIAELGGLYRFGQKKLTFDALFGARAIFMSTDIEITGASGGDAEEDSSLNYFGPLVGGRLIYNFTPRWFTSLRVDGSGFGIDDHWTVNGTVLFGYRFTNLFSMVLGYRYMILDMEDDDLEIQQTLQGPLIGFGFTF